MKNIRDISTWLSRLTGQSTGAVALPPGNWLRTDMHAHWLPGIDDGAKDVSMSLELVEGLYAMGYRRLIATPHIYPGFYPNTPASIEQAYLQVAPAIAERFPDLRTSFAAEYFIDESFAGLVEDRALLTLDGVHVLVEFSFFAEPPKAGDHFFRMALKGYRPVLAHVERYPYYFHDLRSLTRYQEMGVQFQCNLLSLAGHYGPEVRKQAFRLLEWGWYQWMGTDIHHPGHLEPLRDLQVPAGKIHLLRKQPWNALP